MLDKTYPKIKMFDNFEKCENTKFILSQTFQLVMMQK